MDTFVTVSGSHHGLPDNRGGRARGRWAETGQERERDRRGRKSGKKDARKKLKAEERRRSEREREREGTFFLVAAAEEENEGPPGTERQGARRMSCCAHRGVDPRPLGRSYAVVSVPLSHGRVYIRVLTAFKLQSYIEKWASAVLSSLFSPFSLHSSVKTTGVRFSE